MGNWHVAIDGGGIHDNRLHDDVEQMTGRFVQELRARGHHVTAATVTTGGAIDVAGPTVDDQHVPTMLNATVSDPYVGAKRAYDKYVAHAGGLNYEGKPCPAWSELPQAIRDHWLAAVSP